MYSSEDILEAARCIRPFLQELSGSDAEDLDRQLAELLAARDSQGVENQILDLVACREATREWMRQFLENRNFQKGQPLEVQRNYSPLPGSPSPVGAVRFKCPQGDYVWYQFSVGTPAPQCPTHRVDLVRT